MSETEKVKRNRLTRDQTAALLGITLSGLQHIERRCELVRHRDQTNNVFYYQDDVEALKLARGEELRPGRPKGNSRPRRAIPSKYAPEADPYGEQGRRAAAVFRAFKDGKSIQDVVIELEVSPIQVRKLYHEWVTPLSRKPTEEEKEALRMQRQDDRHENALEIERMRLEAARLAARTSPAERPLKAYEKRKE